MCKHLTFTLRPHTHTHTQHAFQIDSLILKHLLGKFLPDIKAFMDVSCCSSSLSSCPVDQHLCVFSCEWRELMLFRLDALLTGTCKYAPLEWFSCTVHVALQVMCILLPSCFGRSSHNNNIIME